MAKYLSAHLNTKRIPYWLLIIFLGINLVSFKTDEKVPKKPSHQLTTQAPLLVHPIGFHSFDNDPIRFAIRADKQRVALGEEVTLTITAHYLNISPALLFITDGANAFRLKVLLPEGFVQTGGDYSDYVGAKLSASVSTATYTLRGYFTKAASPNEFRLLRGQANADVNSLFVEKAQVRVQVNEAVSNQQKAKGAREGALSFQIVSYDCNSGVLQYQFISSDGSPVNVTIPGVFGGAMSPNSVASYTFPGDARQGRAVTGTASQNGDQISISFTTSCNLSSGQSSNPTPNQPTTPVSNPSSSGNGSLNFQIVSYDCNSGTFQYQFTSGSGSSVNVTLPGIFGGTMNSNSVATYTFPGDARQGRTVTGTANQDGNQINISFTTSCNLSSGQSSNPTSNQPTTPTSNPSSGGNGSLNFQIVSYDCNSGTMQYQFTSGDSSPINVTIPGVFGGAMSPNSVATYTFPSDARQGRMVTGTASQGGNQININFTTSCNLSSGQSSNPTNQPSNPSYNPSTGCGTGNGLLGFYTNSTDLSQNLVAVRIDPQINFSWDNSPIPGVVNADQFTVRWIGQVEAPVSGNYTFKTNNDDGTRLWVNGQLLINDWNGHSPTWQQGSIYLNAGQKYDISIDYLELYNGAQAQLYWEYTGQTLQLVPSCRLYPSPTAGYSDPTASASKPLCVFSTTCTDIYWDCNGGGAVIEEVPKDNCGGGGTPMSPHTGAGGGAAPGGPAPGGPSSPIKPNINVLANLSNEELSLNKFYGDMLSRGVTFTNDEKAVLSENPDLRAKVRTYVYINGGKPDGYNAFKLSLADQQSYPKFANLLRNNVRDYAMNNPKILNALKQFSGLSEQKIRVFLTLGSGPTLVISQVYDTSYWGKEGYEYGSHDPQTPDIINIDKLTIQYYENENSWPELEKAYFTLLAQTLIHELSHYGAAVTQTVDFTDGEKSAGGTRYEHRFDIAAYGYPNLPNYVLSKILLKKPKP